MEIMLINGWKLTLDAYSEKLNVSHSFDSFNTNTTNAVRTKSGVKYLPRYLKRSLINGLRH